MISSSEGKRNEKSKALPVIDQRKRLRPNSFCRSFRCEKPVRHLKQVALFSRGANENKIPESQVDWEPRGKKRRNASFVARSLSLFLVSPPVFSSSLHLSPHRLTGSDRLAFDRGSSRQTDTHTQRTGREDDSEETRLNTHQVTGVNE